MTRIGDALAEAARALAPVSSSAGLDARVLMEHCLSRDHAWLLIHGDDPLGAGESERFRSLVEHRKQGRPVAYIVGWKEFWSLRLEIDDSVLVPRPETEHLVEHALAFIPDNLPCRIVDLGTGSGAIALAVARERPACRVTATDISEPALGLAAKNARRLGIDNVRFVRSDWYQALNGQRFDLVLSNPPYVAERDPCLGDANLGWEPEAALTAGPSGLEALRIIAMSAARHLTDGGRILVEHGFEQQHDVDRMLQEGGLKDIQCHSDYAGHPRVTAARNRRAGSA